MYTLSSLVHCKINHAYNHAYFYFNTWNNIKVYNLLCIELNVKGEKKQQSSIYRSLLSHIAVKLAKVAAVTRMTLTHCDKRVSFFFPDAAADMLHNVHVLKWRGLWWRAWGFSGKLL